MLPFDQIVAQYPTVQQHHRRHILTEYLQTKILKAIFTHPLSSKLSFLGGTVLRIVYGNQRFSEDLDFDNFGLTEPDFRAISLHVQQAIKKEGLTSDIQIVNQTAFRCKIRIQNLLFDLGLSGHTEQKILIQIDSQAQGYDYQPERYLLNRFDVFQFIQITPIDVLLSQKLYTAFNRPRLKGRDFFDITFLATQTSVNWGYLKLKLNISTATELQHYLQQSAEKLDFEQLTHDVEPFLMDSDQINRIRFFQDFISSWKIT